ncbi:MAG TPA: hypothetical protein VKI61_12690 [Chitinophagaceae bacterium]|jgi:hypothetical protein|nr:hypothetical protein [Chitinophagaceae bacterium]
MKKLLVFSIFLLTLGAVSAQTKPVAKKSATKGKRVTKKSTSAVKTEFDELVCYQDGPCTFSIHKGDTLVYDVFTTGNQYTMMVIPNKFDAGVVADFNWITTGSVTKKGHVTISSKALQSGKSYLSTLPEGELKLTDASALWLGADNFKDLSKKETPVAFDNGKAETFLSPDEDAVSSPVNYKGKDISLEGFAIQTKPEGEPDRKEIWVLNISSNLLMFKITSTNFTMQLKEVHEKKIAVSAAKKTAAPAKKKA